MLRLGAIILNCCVSHTFHRLELNFPSNSYPDFYHQRICDFTSLLLRNGSIFCGAFMAQLVLVGN